MNIQDIDHSMTEFMESHKDEAIMEEFANQYDKTLLESVQTVGYESGAIAWA